MTKTLAETPAILRSGPDSKKVAGSASATFFRLLRVELTIVTGNLFAGLGFVFLNLRNQLFKLLSRSISSRL